MFFLIWILVLLPFIIGEVLNQEPFLECILYDFGVDLYMESCSATEFTRRIEDSETVLIADSPGSYCGRMEVPFNVQNDYTTFSTAYFFRSNSENRAYFRFAQTGQELDRKILTSLNQWNSINDTILCETCFPVLTEIELHVDISEGDIFKMKYLEIYNPDHDECTYDQIHTTTTSSTTTESTTVPSKSPTTESTSTSSAPLTESPTSQPHSSTQDPMATKAFWIVTSIGLLAIFILFVALLTSTIWKFKRQKPKQTLFRVEIKSGINRDLPPRNYGPFINPLANMPSKY